MWQVEPSGADLLPQYAGKVNIVSEVCNVVHVKVRAAAVKVKPLAIVEPLIRKDS